MNIEKMWMAKFEIMKFWIKYFIQVLLKEYTFLFYFLIKNSFIAGKSGHFQTYAWE